MEEQKLENVVNENESGQMTAAVEQKKEKKPESKGWKIAKAILMGFLLIILFYVVQVALTMGITIVNMVYMVAIKGQPLTAVGELAKNGDYLTMVTGITTFATAVLFGIWYKCKFAKSFTKESWNQLGKRILHARTILLIVLSGMTVYMISILIITIMDQVAHETVSSFNEMMGLTMSGNPVIVFVTLVILAPIGEECLFRGLIFNRLQKAMPLVAAIIIQAVMFGIFHGNPVQGIYVITLGLVTGYAAYKLHSVVPCIIIHAINNSMGYLMDALPESITENNVILICIFAAFVIGTFLVWKFMEEKSYGDE